MTRNHYWHPALTAFFACCLSLSVATQSTFIVDSQNRPGADFINLPNAVALAETGDTLVLRPGTYSAFSTDKGLRILGEPGAEISLRSGLFLGADILIEGLPADQEFVLRGLSLRAAPTSSLRVESCAGRVSFQALRARTQDIRCRLTDASNVTIDRCHFENLPITIHGGRCAITDSIVSGDLATGPSIDAGAPAVTVNNADVTITQTELTGGSVGIHRFGPGSAALQATMARVTLTGDNQTEVRAGAGNGDRSAIEGVGSTIVIDGRVQLTSSGSAPPAADTLSLVSRPIAALSLEELEGDALRLRLTSTPGETVLMLVGRPGIPSNAAPIDGTLWIDPTTPILSQAGVQSSEGSLTARLRIPTAPELVGLTLTWQALTVGDSGLGLSNPASFTLSQ